MTGWIEDRPPPVRIGSAGRVRALLRIGLVGGLTYGCLVLLLLVRLVERPLCGLDRPVTPGITRFVCRNALRLMGLRLTVTGAPMRERGALVANHGSWLDIFVLNAIDRLYFVSKAEVAAWAGIGWLARATGTVFIARKGSEAKLQEALFRDRLQAGHRLLFFPEGTSTDTLRVVPFKSTLFAAFFADGLREVLSVQPVTVVYRAPPGQDARFYGWWGDMEFAPHLLRVLAQAPQGSVEVTWHPPLRVADFADRKALAAACEATIRQAHGARSGAREVG
jgi:1-acyl-sn-glycerol-3-phosphate acyltransferase